MSTLNVTEEKFLKLIEPHISDIQKTINERIRGTTCMTAAVIYEVFCKANKCDVGSDSFIKGFRAAVKVGKITGIESAKRAGYRRIGSKGVKSAASNASMGFEAIAPYLEGVQVFVDEHIQGSKRMTAAAICTEFSKKNKCELSTDEFAKCFRLAVRAGKITGLESAYKFGYKRASESSTKTKTEGETETDSSDESGESSGHHNEVVIDETRKLVHLDSYNWGYQVRKDSGRWVTEGYYSNFHSCLKGLARKLVDSEFKQVQSDISEMLPKIEEVEDKLVGLLKKALS